MFVLTNLWITDIKTRSIWTIYITNTGVVMMCEFLLVILAVSGALAGVASQTYTLVLFGLILFIMAGWIIFKE